jgi:hypothetical protein
MTPERWQQVSRIYDGALSPESGARAAFLREACGGDEALRRDVDSLLARNEADDAVRDQPVELSRIRRRTRAGSIVTGRRLGAYEIKGARARPAVAHRTFIHSGHRDLDRGAEAARSHALTSAREDVVRGFATVLNGKPIPPA